MTHETTAAPRLEGAAVRDALRRLHAGVRREGVLLYPGMFVMGVLAGLEGRSGWMYFWFALGTVFVLGRWSAWAGDRAREAVVLAADDEAVRAYLLARLDVVTPAARKLGWSFLFGHVMLLTGLVVALAGEPGWQYDAGGDWLLGWYFIGSRLNSRLVRAPGLAAMRAALSPDPGEPRTETLDGLAAAVLESLGELPATVFVRETTGATSAQAKAAVALLRAR